MWQPPDPSNPAWRIVQDDDRYWDQFTARFAFNHRNRPAIREPSPSTTFDLSPIFTGLDFAAGEEEVNDAVLAAMLETFEPDQRLIALDWQHPTYLVWPHHIAPENDGWRIQPFPNGDYFIFVTEDMDQGMFGDPFEQTLCVIGEPLLRAVTLRLPRLPVKRQS